MCFSKWLPYSVFVFHTWYLGMPDRKKNVFFDDSPKWLHPFWELILDFDHIHRYFCASDIKGPKNQRQAGPVPEARPSYTNQKSLNARGAGSSWLDSGLPPWDTGVLTWFRGWRPDSRVLLARWKRSGLWAFQVGPPRPFTISIRWNTVAQTHKSPLFKRVAHEGKSRGRGEGRPASRSNKWACCQFSWTLPSQVTPPPSPRMSYIYNIACIIPHALSLLRDS